MPTPSLNDFKNVLGSQLHEELLERISFAGISYDDPSMVAVLQDLDLVRRATQDNAETFSLEVKQQLAQILNPELIAKAVEITLAARSEEQARIEAQKEQRFLALIEKVSNEQAPATPFGRKFSRKMGSEVVLGAMLAIGFVLGVVPLGLWTFYVYVPQAVAATRLQNAEDIKYLNSKQGKYFRSIVQLNDRYLDEKCKTLAANRGLTLKRDNVVYKNVCLVFVP